MKPEHKKTVFISVALIIILGFAVYGNSLDGKFIWDDEGLIKGNIYIRSFSNIPKLFTEGIRAGAQEEDSFYRPLQIFTYMIDYSLWKLNVRGYHLTNAFLHILVALGIYWLIGILFKDQLLALFAGIFFVVHPIHTEAVVYISGRADPLAAVFMLLCIIFYIKNLHLKSTTSYIIMLLSYVLALLSRENSLILPALLLLYHYAFKRKFKLNQIVPLLTITFIYILLRLTVLRFLLSNISDIPPLLQRIPGFFVAVTDYTRLLLLPFNLHMEYGSILFDFADPKAILGILILISLLIYAYRIRNSNKLAFFSILWFFIALLPQSNLYPANAYMAEHWLYLPSIGFFLILARGISYIYTTKKLKTFTIILVVGLLAFYSYLTIRQNDYWKEPMTFYKRTLKYAPHSARVHSDLGAIYCRTGRLEEATVLFKKAIELDPNYIDAYYNSGLVYSAIGQKEKAIASFKKVIEINPSDAAAHFKLSVAYFHKRLYALAIKHCDKARELGYRANPEFLKLLEPYRQ